MAGDQLAFEFHVSDYRIPQQYRVLTADELEKMVLTGTVIINKATGCRDTIVALCAGYVYLRSCPTRDVEPGELPHQNLTADDLLKNYVFTGGKPCGKEIR